MFFDDLAREHGTSPTIFHSGLHFANEDQQFLEIELWDKDDKEKRSDLAHFSLASDRGLFTRANVSASERPLLRKAGAMTEPELRAALEDRDWATVREIESYRKEEEGDYHDMFEAQHKMEEAEKAARRLKASFPLTAAAILALNDKPAENARRHINVVHAVGRHTCDSVKSAR